MSEETRISDALPSARIGVGTRLSDIYQIDSLIDVGGMGEVYLGHTIETGDQVAIKTILPEFARNEAALALFRKEASALHRVNNEAIVRYYVFTVDRVLSVPYLAMEYVSGESLCDIARRGPVEFESLRVLQRRLASGLQAAHDHGIFHRDVSPDNIILPQGDFARAKIIDFGIARSTLGDKTIVGNGFAGKLGYVSPEQLGLFGGNVAAASDIYSLGLVLAEAALGRSLDMGGSHAEVVDKRRKVPDLGGLDTRIRPLLEAMLQPDPAKRPGSMAEVAAWAPSRPAPPPKRSRRGLGLAIAGLVLVAGLGGGAYVLLPEGGEGGRKPGRIEEVPTSLEERAPAPSAPALQQAEPPAAVPPPVPQPQPQPAPRRTPAPSASAPGPVPTPVIEDQPQGAAPAETPIPSPPSTPSSPEPPVRRAAPTMDQIATFIREYRAGDCTVLSPVSVSSREAVIEAFGASTAPFEAFDAEFQRALGFEPRIQLRLVSAEQCPAINLLARQGGARQPRVPKLAIRPDLLKSGQELSGTADAGGQPNLELILVADDGLSHTITSYAKRAADTLTFALRIEGSGGGVAKPQLVLAVASAKPLSSVKELRGMPAAKALAQLEEEAGRTRTAFTVVVRYFKLAP